ncbi:MAG: hypothetical protein IT449_00380 [Phycisphaerales bacterium]|nr:hypothetical protein [Phycisphaerales bacterium]
MMKSWAVRLVFVVVGVVFPSLSGEAVARFAPALPPQASGGDAVEVRFILGCLPDDAAAVLFADSPQRFVSNPLFATVVPSAGELPGLRAALAPFIDGPVALALRPEGGSPAPRPEGASSSLRVEVEPPALMPGARPPALEQQGGRAARFVPLVVAKLRAGVDDPMKRLRDALPKSINASALAEAAGLCTGALNDDGSVTLKFERYPDVFLAQRGGVVVAATDAYFVAEFQTGRKLEHALAARAEIACWFRAGEGSSRAASPAGGAQPDGIPRDGSDPPRGNTDSDVARGIGAGPLAACYVNLSRLEQGYGAPMPIWPLEASTLPGWGRPDRFALVEDADRVRVALTRSGTEGVLPAFMDGPANERTLAEFFPTDDVFMLSASLPSGWERIMRSAPLTERLQPDEGGARVLLGAMSGIDLPEGMLPLPAGRWAFGGRVDGDGHIAGGLLAVALQDAAAFERKLAEYRRKPGSNLITNIVDGVTIDHWIGSNHWTAVTNRAANDPARPPGRRIYSTMVLDDVLLIADEPHTLVEALEARESHRTLDAARFFPKLAGRLPRERALLTSVELETLFRSMPMQWHSKLDPAWRRFARNHPSILLAAVPIEGGACIDVVSAPSSKAGWSDAWEAAAAEFESLRAQARRGKSAYQLRTLVAAMLIHAGDHEGAGPPTLEALLEDGDLSASMLACPYPKLASKAVAHEPFYVLRNLPNLGSLRKTKESLTEVMAGERMIHDGGANFAFVDGHVEWVESPRAEELLKQLAGTD